MNSFKIYNFEGGLNLVKEFLKTFRSENYWSLIFRLFLGFLFIHIFIFFFPHFFLLLRINLPIVLVYGIGFFVFGLISFMIFSLMYFFNHSSRAEFLDSEIDIYKNGKLSQKIPFSLIGEIKILQDKAILRYRTVSGVRKIIVFYNVDRFLLDLLIEIRKNKLNA